MRLRSPTLCNRQLPVFDQRLNPGYDRRTNLVGQLQRSVRASCLPHRSPLCFGKWPGQNPLRAPQLDLISKVQVWCPKGLRRGDRRQRGLLDWSTRGCHCRRPRAHSCSCSGWLDRREPQRQLLALGRGRERILLLDPRVVHDARLERPPHGRHDQLHC